MNFVKRKILILFILTDNRRREIKININNKNFKEV